VAASKESLEALHTAVVVKLTESIDAMAPGEKGLAAILNVARQLLKDEGIEAMPAEGSAAGRLKKKLEEFPFHPDDLDRTH
jgi:hypothetical protein